MEKVSLFGGGDKFDPICSGGIALKGVFMKSKPVGLR